MLSTFIKKALLDNNIGIEHMFLWWYNKLSKGGFIMPTLSAIKSDISTLSNMQIKELFEYIGQLITISTVEQDLYKNCKEKHFSNGQACPDCGSLHVIKNGKANGRQRYLCKDCKKTFGDLTNSVFSHTKLSLRIWMEYTRCMILGYSIRKSADIVGVCIKTSFFIRHKILDAVRTNMGIGKLEGIVEMDETFFAESFKGNHMRSNTFTMPRKSRKRGKEIKLRGISHEQVCVTTAIDRNDTAVLECVCMGRIRSTDLKRAYNGKINSQSIICSDSHKSYIQFTKDFTLEHVRIKTGKHKNGVYHINHVNALHSNLKEWIRRFKGVATKYLANYLYWFKWLESTKRDKDIMRMRNLLLDSVSVSLDTRQKLYRNRVPIFV
jgi:transposase-like protein